MNIAPFGTVEPLPNADKLPPDKPEPLTNVTDKEWLDSGIISHSMSAEMDSISSDGSAFLEVKSKRSKRNLNGESIMSKRVDQAAFDVDVSKIGSTKISSNRFELLGVLDIEVNENSTTNNNERLIAGVKNKNVKGSGRPVRTKFCPPIILYNVNVKKLIDQLNNRTPKVVYKIINSSQNKSKLYFENLATHLEMMEILRSQNVKSYSFTPSELKRTTVILRGLYHSCEVSDIKAALDVELPNMVEKVSKFTTQFSIKNGVDTGLFIVTLLPGKKQSDLDKIRYLLNQSIKWEAPKYKKNEIQCFRCQIWGHSARNCNSKFRCVKCNSDHVPGLCSVKKGESSPVCVNCNLSGHVANYKGCPAYKTYLKNKKILLLKSKNRSTEANKNVFSTLCNNGVKEKSTFASLFTSDRNYNMIHENKVPSFIEEFLMLGEYFKDSQALSLEKKISNFFKSYKSMPFESAKMEYGNLLKEVLFKYGPK